MFSWSRRNFPTSITGEENQSAIRHKRSHREGSRRSGTGKLPVLHCGDPPASHAQGALPGLVSPLECVALTTLPPPQTLPVGHRGVWFPSPTLRCPCGTRTSLSDLQRVTVKTCSAVPWMAVIPVALRVTTHSLASMTAVTEPAAAGSPF